MGNLFSRNKFTTSQQPPNTIDDQERKRRHAYILMGYNTPQHQWQHVTIDFTKETIKTMLDKCLAVVSVHEKLAKQQQKLLEIKVLYNSKYNLGPKNGISRDNFENVWDEFMSSKFLSISQESKHGLEEFCFRLDEKSEFWFWHINRSTTSVISEEGRADSEGGRSTADSEGGRSKADSKGVGRSKADPENITTTIAGSSAPKSANNQPLTDSERVKDPIVVSPLSDSKNIQTTDCKCNETSLTKRSKRKHSKTHGCVHRTKKIRLTQQQN